MEMTTILKQVEVVIGQYMQIPWYPQIKILH